MTTIPADHRPDYQDVDADLCDELESYLREEGAIGQENAIPTGQIAEDLDVDSTHDTRPKIRDAKNKLLYEQGVPIRGCSNGLFIVKPGSDMEQAIERIRSRIGALNTAKMALEDAVPKYDYPGGEADESPEDDAEVLGDCAKCDGPITGDHVARWFDEPLCDTCYENAPPTEADFREWLSPPDDE